MPGRTFTRDQFSDEFAARFWSKVEKRGEDECWPWIKRLDRYGYGRLVVKPMRLWTAAHRIAFVLATGKSISQELVVRHTCDNPRCCNPAHLIPGTHADNHNDMKVRGRSPRGERHYKATLTNTQAAEVFRRVMSGESRKSIAADFGTSVHVVKHIKYGVTFPDIDRPGILEAITDAALSEAAHT